MMPTHTEIQGSAESLLSGHPRQPADAPGDTRAALRQAIGERDRAKLALAKASAAAQAGKALLAAEERKVRSFDDVEDAIVRHRAASYARAAKGGPKPSLALPADLVNRERLRDEAKAAFRAAKAAYDGLARELALSDRALGDAEARVSKLAIGVLIAVASEQAAELMPAWQQLWTTIDTVNALCPSWLGVSVQLPRETVRTLQFFASMDYRQFAGGRNARLADAGQRWRAWHRALCQDAGADMPAEQVNLTVS